MAHSDNVLHLYVEVRSLADEAKKELDKLGGSHSLNLHSPDTLASRAHNASHSLVPLAGNLHKEACSTHSPSNSKSPPRHLDGLQYPPAPESAHTPPRDGQTLPLDEMYLLSGLQPGNSRGACTLVRTRSSECEPIYDRESRFSKHSTAPSTPIGPRRAFGQEQEGKRSIVTYSYIEKANIKSVRGHHNFVCQTEPNNPFKGAFYDQTIPLLSNKRFSEPVGLSLEPSGNLNSKNMVSKLNDTPVLQKAKLDSVPREVSQRALKEFGSPQLWHQLANNSPNRKHGTWHRELPLCHSWSGTPVVPRTARTLPANAQLICPDQIRTLHGIPRSTASGQFSVDTRQLHQTMPHPTNAMLMGEESPRQAYRHLPSCRPTVIQHEIPAVAITQAPCNQLVSQRASQSPSQTHKVNFSLGCSSNQSAARQKLGGKKSILRASSPEIPRKIVQEPRNRSAFMEARKCPSPTPSLSDSVRSDSPRSGHHSELCAGFHWTSTRTSLDSNPWEREPGQKGQISSCSSTLSPHKASLSAALHARLHQAEVVCTSPTEDPHQEKTEIPVKDGPATCLSQCSSGLKDTHYGPGYASILRDSPEINRKLCTIQSRSSVSQKHWEPTKKESIYEARNPVSMFPKDSRNDSATLSSKENHYREPAEREVLKGDVLVYGEQSSAMSQSSSGITGSLGEVIEPERDSPETSSQASRRSSDTGNTALQVDSGSSVLVHSSHYEKVARAKWEFLFGKPSEDHHGVNVSSTAPCSGYFNQSSRPIPVSPLLSRSKICYFSPSRLLKSQKTASHDDPQVNLELADPPLSSELGSSPKIGIIRRTMKYSETDLDAVPLRCYRETDIDEVISEQEEMDSAFSNDRSVLATSGSTLEGQLCLRANEEVEQFHDDEVVSWASVRMHCDRKRQQTIQDGDEVFTGLLEGRENCRLDSHIALKSPITVASPSRTSTDGLDSFSHHFERIMESHRAKGTSYSSLDSVDMNSSGPHIFTFDLPTLTPEIQTQICESAKQIIELNFSPLTQSESPNILSPSTSEVSAGADQNSVPEESEMADCVPTKDDTPFDMEIKKRERMSGLVSHSDHEVAQRLALGSNENVANGSKADLHAAKLLAKRLYNLDGFRRSDVAKHLSKNNDFSQMVAEEYLSHFNFSGMSVDQALRFFLREFALVGETQERERVLSHFSRRYLQCNPNNITNEDSVHTLTCALMLLNTDLHGPNVGKKMTCMQFVGNLEGLNDGQNFPKDLLKALYNSIKNEKLHWTIDEEEVRKSVSELAESRTDSASHALKRITSGGGPLVALAQQSNAQVYKNGFLVRKVHADPDGKRTPRGKRGWKTFYAILKGLVLYLQKGEYGSDKQLSEEDLKNAVSIHHSLAMKAADYSKRPNVFYLRTADWRVFLFQATNAEQMQSWITRINTVAAMFSAPPFPAAIGSHKKFSRPLLPGSNTKLSQEEQMKSHEMRFRSIASEQQELRSIPQERKPKGKEQEETKQREEYLEFEKTRYGTYAMLLRAKLRMDESDLVAFEARLFADGALQRVNSSPTLPNDTSQASASSSSASRSKKSSRSEGHRHKPAVKQ